MRTYRMTLAFAFSSCLLLILVSSACSDNAVPSATTNLSLDAYLSRVERIFIETQRQEETLVNPFDSPFDTGDDKLPAGRHYVEGIGETIDYEIAELSRLRPGSEALAAHEMFLWALASYRVLWSDLEAQAASASSAAAFNSLLLNFSGSSEFADASRNLEEACGSLQGLADRSTVSVTLCT